MATARVARGRRTQKVVAAWLRAHGWPRAEAVEGCTAGKDILYTPGHAIEVKARTAFDPKAWLKQAKENSKPGEIPCVVMRMNGQGEGDVANYLVFRRLADDELSRRGA